ncbi:hypothetical protein COW36_15260 [bacterium (Candidatus Blackallbacteria) CG17_big_fil_post_rev_8_21_14_2_50_48_46]|uniref:Uncharacterized protein n=1 Tax=bacterium (Candidatus Blackallbacteria) CG17_big_fil_post_rev_8_21_14_2_50_48_46 TaxID=2014261 RepID=A0A2M7G2N7_9BACT|nr:MAG: hypothetical protein COW64_11290 [bacterium (Candidatus Blackallbacteria) CG18_big_fil_WC_8_21_14_2_50_49_26]PIW16068.1 MAG: hypothetical protein COW36_15260 [bacterium (Candidatus Blackallbacteria) CG17_big_fil_post_rev_8_21_14_2_50_48_46]PIW50480.1 MAG: hypothetical protein COW20_02975 [bacterium (Candidatus Blackallbacteria) CG13_big_fil_rev_8_21_14_2_50_49_14]
MKRIFLFLLFCLLPLMAWATPEKPGIGVETEFPMKGQPVQIFVSHATWQRLEEFQFSVTYRPNSMVSHTQELGHPDPNGYLTWTPADAGVTILKATIPGSKEKDLTITKQLSVRYGQFPLLGILIFLLAAFTLFGGLAWTVVRSKPA